MTGTVQHRDVAGVPETTDVESSRRSVLKGALTTGAAMMAAGLVTGSRTAPARADTPAASATADRVVALGLDGGPRVNNSPAGSPSAKPSLALVVSGQTYLVDAGLDTARQLVRAGLAFGSVRNLFVTHHHLDHTSGLAGLVLNGWTAASPLATLDAWGPPSMSAQLNGIRTAYGEEARLFLAGGSFPPFPTLRGHEVAIPPGTRIQRVMEDANVVVDAVHVFHGPEVRNAYAYRFSVKGSGKVVVFSGDTAAPDANLVALAAGCDLLVHEVQDVDNVAAVVASIPDRIQAEALREHLLESHSSIQDVPAVAQAAGAKALMFCHYAPFPQPPAVYLAKARTAADAIGYRGSIIAPAELDVVPL